MIMKVSAQAVLLNEDVYAVQERQNEDYLVMILSLLLFSKFTIQLPWQNLQLDFNLYLTF